MFIKYTKSGSNIYVQLTQSYRDKKGKPRHRVMLNLGRKDELENSTIVDDIIRGLSKLSKELLILDKGEFNAHTKILGTVLAVEAIWKKLQLEKKLNGIKSQYKITYDLNNAVKMMVINRLSDPKSKLGITEWKKGIFFDSSHIKLQHLYRSLDVLADNKETIEEDLYNTSLSLFKPEIRVVFYDLTTIYFESQEPDELRRFGYSKDNKTDCTQAVIGLVMSKDGLPLGYNVFRGNTSEGSTVKSMLDKLHLRYKIGKLVFVGDRGLLSKKVLREIEEAGYEYIVAAKLKSLPKLHHQQVLDRSQYRQINEELWLSEMDIEGKRLVLGYSSKRAGRDRKQREEVLKKLEVKLGNNSAKSVLNSQYSRFLSVGKAEVKIDPEKIKEAEKWDGFFGYYTNNRALTQEEILDSYHLLWQVEDAFRHMKSTLDMRPVYHWTPKRIEGHIMLCFLSFYMLKLMDMMLKNKDIGISIKKALEIISDIRAIEIKHDGRIYTARTEIAGDKFKILRALSCRIPKAIIHEKVVA